eukprot:m.65656 g.65656  ORF g.65656 m.65656 type:complete len:68 (+) comp23584_c0_seq2:55-258(+)
MEDNNSRYPITMANVDCKSIVIQVDNCEHIVCNGFYRENGQRNGKPRYKNLKSCKYNLYHQTIKRTL